MSGEPFVELEAITGEWDTAVIRPGDTLIIRINPNSRFPVQAADDMRKQVKAKFPNLDDVVYIVADGFAIYRPDSEATT